MAVLAIPDQSWEADILVHQLHYCLNECKLDKVGIMLELSFATSSASSSGEPSEPSSKFYILGSMYKKEPIMHACMELLPSALDSSALKIRVVADAAHIVSSHRVLHSMFANRGDQPDSICLKVWSASSMISRTTSEIGNHLRLQGQPELSHKLGSGFELFVRVRKQVAAIPAACSAWFDFV
jgi:hypothetical protein